MRRMSLLILGFVVLCVAPGLPVAADRNLDDRPQSTAPGQPLAGLPRPDPFPHYPPLSELRRLPTRDIAAGWMRLQQNTLAEADAKADDMALSRELRSKYQDLKFETMNRMLWCMKICRAHDNNLSERVRRNCLNWLSGMDAYYTGKWPAPVPLELMPEKDP